jgi:hypothetical protein
MVLPGFGAFRYPSKLATFLTVAVAVLAGAGWDRATAGETARPRRLALAGLATSAVGLAAVFAARHHAIAWIAGRIPRDVIYGPADVAAAWDETRRAVAHGAIIFASIVVLVWWAPRRPSRAGSLALLLLAVDLAVANGRLIWTVPQSEFESVPEVARRIEAAEGSHPSSGPYRIHRMYPWYPVHFLSSTNDQRLREALNWERKTLQHNFGLPLGFEYCDTMGNMDLDDYFAFFAAQPEIPVPAAMARTLGVLANHPVFYFPRRSFDLCGARYFILPAFPDWSAQQRGFASFLTDTDLLYPDRDTLFATPPKSPGDRWAVRHDWQLRRNRAVYPRAWVVHDARVRPVASDPAVRDRLTASLTFMNDPIWSEPGRPVYNLRETALIETADRHSLLGFLPGPPVGPTESVKVVKYEPQRVELLAMMDRPGLVILADTYYPGWNLLIDGRSAPIYRANRVMRAAAVAAGSHTLVYTYEPLSFRIGTMVSVAGLVGFGILSYFAWQRPRYKDHDASAIRPAETAFSAGKLPVRSPGQSG